MLHPQSIKHLEVDFALDFAHDFFAKFDFFAVVSLFDCGECKLGAIFFLAHEADFVDEVFVKVEDGFEFFVEILVNAGRNFGQSLGFFFHQAFDFGEDVFALENLAANHVNDAAVTVNHVIVLNDVLAGVEVETFDTFLSGFESLRNHTSLDWRIFVDTETSH